MCVFSKPVSADGIPVWLDSLPPVLLGLLIWSFLTPNVHAVKCLRVERCGSGVLGSPAGFMSIFFSGLYVQDQPGVFERAAR